MGHSFEAHTMYLRCPSQVRQGETPTDQPLIRREPPVEFPKMAVHCGERSRNLSLPFRLTSSECAFEVDEPGIAMVDRELPLILLAQIPSATAEQKFVSQV